MGVEGLTEREMAAATVVLFEELVGRGSVPLDTPNSPISSPLRGWYDGRPIYIQTEPEVISKERQTIRRWRCSGYLVTITSDFSNAPRRIERTIEVCDQVEAGDGSSVGGM